MASTNIGVNLDELVLAGIASHLHFIDRIFQERVSRRFAKSLQMANESSQISLTINKNWMENSPFTFVPEQLDVPEDDKTAILRKRFSAPETKITEAFAVLFARFKRYRIIEILTDPVKKVTDSILAVISKDSHRPTELIDLKYTFDKAVDVDFRLIDTLSPLIKNLALHCSMPTTEAGSKKLWTSVADCKNLQKLSFFPQNRIMRCSRDAPKPDDFSNVHLCECLKVRKIRHFRSGYGAQSYGSHWLAEAFKDNHNLRKLFIDDYSLRLNTFTDPTVLPIISKLRTLGINFDSSDAQAGDIVKILCALKAKGYPTVSQTVDYSVYLRHEEETGIADEPLKDLKKLEDALKSWLKMSDQTVCFVKLCLTLFTPPISITNRAINALKGTAEFADLVVEQKSNRTILRHKNARIQLSICNRNDGMPLKIW